MNLFEQLVDEAIKNQQSFSPLRNVVEKELLHHDILRVLSNEGMLANLTFMGGTCLRACYGSNRLSEDLDFTGGAGFNHQNLAKMSKLLVKSLVEKYGLHVEVSAPICEVRKVSTWKLKLVTRPDRINDLPAQRINIDICSIPSYQTVPMMLLNPYGVEMGTGGLILNAESREEIFADKLIAFALRANRIKYRDLWDIFWLHQKTIKPALSLIPKKLDDHKCQTQYFLRSFDQRSSMLQTNFKLEVEFVQEMQRFLPVETVTQTLSNKAFWVFITNLIDDLYTQVKLAI
jgi:predicted nucleotidyltransferase component of viral defense system